MNATHMLDGTPRAIVVDRSKFSARYNTEYGSHTQVLEHLPAGSGWSGMIAFIFAAAQRFGALSRSVDLQVLSSPHDSSLVRLGVVIDQGTTVFVSEISGRSLMPDGATTVGGLKVADAVSRICDVIDPAVRHLDTLRDLSS